MLQLYILCQENLRIILLEHHAGNRRRLERIKNTEHRRAAARHESAVCAIGHEDGLDVIQLRVRGDRDLLKDVAKEFESK